MSPLADRLASPSGRDLVGYGAGFVGVAIFGGTLPMTRIAVATFDPWFVAFGRAALASIAAALLLAVLRRPLPPRRSWPWLAAAGAGTVVGFPLFSAVAMVTVPASHGGVLLGLLPLATSVAAVLINGERPSFAFWALGALGAAIVLVFTLRSADASFGPGDLALLASVACASTGYACYARASADMRGWEAISWALVAFAPLTFAVSAWTFEPAYLDAGSDAVGALLYVAFFSVFIGFFFWNAGLAIGGVARVGQLQRLQTFVTLAIAAVMNGEPLSFETVGFATAVALVVLAARKRSVART